jgi:PAS domain S-box-containing protein
MEEKHYKDIVENLNSAIAIIESDGKYRMVCRKAARIFGAEKHQVEGKYLHEIHNEDVASTIMENIKAALDANGPQRFEIFYNGRWYSVDIVPYLQNENGINGVQTQFYDITEHKESQTNLENVMVELVNSNKELSQFANIIAHDLKEPLRTVYSYLNLVMKYCKDTLDKEAKEFMEFAVDGARRMEKQIESLLDYARIDTKGKPFEITDIEHTVDTAIVNLDASIENAGANIIKETPFPSLYCDGAQILRLFQNLIANALKYHSEKKIEIRIGAEEKENAWRFYVADNGIGIDPKYQLQIFQVFRRLHSINEYSGTGMGLAICKKIVERHKGNIWVESTQGEGSTFYFELPKRSINRN